MSILFRSSRSVGERWGTFSPLFVFVTTILIVFSACSRVGSFPHSSGTDVDLSKKNFRVVKANAVGSSLGFYFLGIIPISPPSYTNAMTDLYDEAGVMEGTAQAIVNVTQERSTLYLILFSIPKLTVRADIVEFVEEPQSEDKTYGTDRFRKGDYKYPRREIERYDQPRFRQEVY